MKNLIYIFPITLLMFSCGSESAEDSEGISDSLQTDTLELGIQFRLNDSNEIDASHLLSLFTGDTLEIPFTIDSLMVDEFEIEGKTKLSAPEIKFISKKYLKTDGHIGDWGNYDIEQSINMDQRRIDGTMEDYQASLDIGMMRISDVYAMGALYLSDSSWICLWLIDFSSYEACPYSSGRNVYATLVADGEISTTYLVAEQSAGGDPPVWGNTNITSSFEEGTIRITGIFTHGEEGENGDEYVETSEETTQLAIEEGELILDSK